MSAAPAASLPSPHIDDKAAATFLRSLAGGDTQARFTFQTLDDSGAGRPNCTHILHGTYQECRSDLGRFNRRGAGVFVTVNETDLKGRRAENIIRVRALFVDLDGALLEPVQNAKLRPHLIVETSPGRWHAYWRVRDAPLDEFHVLQKALAATFGGDPSVCDPPRLMRIPGFLHNKGHPARSRLLTADDHSPYSVAEIRDWLGVEQSCTPVAERAEKTIDTGPVLQGHRNPHLMSIAGTLRARGCSAETIAAAVEAENVARCQPPLEAREVERITRGISRYPAGETAGKRPQLPDAALHGIAGEIARCVASCSEADPAAVLLSVLVRAGATFGPRVFVPVGDTPHPPRLFASKVGTSSRARKGTSEAPVRRIFEVAEALLNKPIVADGKLDLDTSIWTPLTVTDGPMSSGEGLVHAVRDPSDELDDDGQPRDQRVSDKRLLVIEGEFGAPLKAAQREGNTLSAILRSAWDHGNIAPLTKSRRIKATGAHICVIAHVTQQELRQLLNSCDIWNGFANRFLWALVARPRLDPRPQPVPDSEVDRFAERLAQVFRRASRGRIPLDPETERQWDALYPDLSADRPGPYGSSTARAEAQVLRIALTYALLDGSDTIRPAHLRAAVALWQFCDESAEAIFAGIQPEPLADRILELLAKGELNLTQLHKGLSGHARSPELQAALRSLVSQGLVMEIRIPTGGRPECRYRLAERARGATTSASEAKEAKELTPDAAVSSLSSLLPPGA